jgi:hypothetical protein
MKRLILLALVVTVFGGCTTWPDEDSFDKLVSAFANAQTKADAGDAEAEQFLGVVREWRFRGEAMRALNRYDDDENVVKLKCIDTGTGKPIAVPPSDHDTKVSVAELLQCLWDLDLGAWGSTHGAITFCAEEMTDQKAQRSEAALYEKGRNAYCQWHLSPALSSEIKGFRFEAMTPEQAALTFLGLREVPNSGWNWAWISANILGGITRDHTFPGCTLCNGAPVGGDK